MVTEVVTAAVACLYVLVFFVQLPYLHEGDNPAPAFLALAVLYVAGAVLLAVWDKPVLQWVGAAIQVILIVLFVWLPAGLDAYAGESFVRNMTALAVAITAAQVTVFALYVYLAASGRRQLRDVPSD